MIFLISLMEWSVSSLLLMVCKNKPKNTEYLSKRTIVNCNFVANGF